MTVLDLRGAEKLGTPEQLVLPGSPIEVTPRINDGRLGALIVLSDAVALILSYALFSLGDRAFLQRAPYLAVFLGAISAYGLHGSASRRRSRSWFFGFGRLTRAVIAGSVASLLISALLHRLAGAPQLAWPDVAAVAVPALVVVPGLRQVVSLVARRQGIAFSRVAVVGSSESAERVVRRLKRARDVRLVGIITDAEPSLNESVRFLGGTVDLAEICEHNQLNRIFISADSHNVDQLRDALRGLPRRVQISIVPAFSDLLTWQSTIDDLDGLPVLDVPAARVDPLRRIAKRAMDITFSAAALLLLAPVMLAIAVAVKVTSAGPVLFRQARIGYRGQPFVMVKFRTMDSGAEEAKKTLFDLADGRLFKLPLDPRVTAVGRFLRKTSLDELPQFLNVLVGHMSLVGPRPLIPSESACFDGWATQRFTVKPGMTGLWQVSGRSDLPFEELCQLDYAYAASWSLWWDLKILLQTPASVLRCRGAY